MQLEAAKRRITEIEPMLTEHPFVEMCVLERNGRRLHLALTDRLRRRAKRGRVWKSKPFLTALKNAEYGFDPQLARSPGGRDGLFLLDRTFKPANAMMRKIFGGYLDKSGSSAGEVASALGTALEKLQAVRLVSHHMRLLGVLWQSESSDWVVLVDYDNTK